MRVVCVQLAPLSILAQPFCLSVLKYTAQFPGCERTMSLEQLLAVLSVQVEQELTLLFKQQSQLVQQLAHATKAPHVVKLFT